MSRLLAYGFGLGVVALVAAPGFGDPRDDSYPLSTYPMFARPRGKPQLAYVEGIQADGASVRIGPELVAHNEVMQAAATVKRAVRAGPAAMQELCTRIARDLAEEPDQRAVMELHIVLARFDPVAYFSSGPVPEEHEVLSRCIVPRSP